MNNRRNSYYSMNIILADMQNKRPCYLILWKNSGRKKGFRPISYTRQNCCMHLLTCWSNNIFPSAAGCWSSIVAVYRAIVPFRQANCHFDIATAYIFVQCGVTLLYSFRWCSSLPLAVCCRLSTRLKQAKKRQKKTRNWSVFTWIKRRYSNWVNRNTSNSGILLINKPKTSFIKSVIIKLNGYRLMNHLKVPPHRI